MAIEFLIIDGYNVMRSAGFIRDTVGPGMLTRARQMFLGFLAKGLDEETRARTTVVFDAKSAPEDGSIRELVNEIQVVFAVEYDEADDMIEYLIKRHSAPKQLTVVSSDHRLQNAAKRRNARFVDSEIWFDRLRDLIHEERSNSEDSEPELRDAYKNKKLDAEDTAKWMEEFKVLDEEVTKEPDSIRKTKKKFDASEEIEEREETGYGPFPPGYGEDLLEDI